MSEEFYERLAEVRHYIHQHPEVSEKEYETTAYIKNLKVLKMMLISLEI